MCFLKRILKVLLNINQCEVAKFWCKNTVLVIREDKISHCFVCNYPSESCNVSL